jgi:hypothetical protein
MEDRGGSQKYSNGVLTDRRNRGGGKIPQPDRNAKLYQCTFFSGVWCESPILGPGQVVESGVGQPTFPAQNGHSALPAFPVQQGYPHRSKLELSCRPGHSQKGDLVITCQANGKWSRPDGACHSESFNNCDRALPPRVRPYRLKFFFAYKRNKANLDPFHLCFTISL